MLSSYAIAVDGKPENIAFLSHNKIYQTHDSYIYACNEETF
jgi:hypothetical protein